MRMLLPLPPPKQPKDVSALLRCLTGFVKISTTLLSRRRKTQPDPPGRRNPSLTGRFRAAFFVSGRRAAFSLSLGRELLKHLLHLLGLLLLRLLLELCLLSRGGRSQ